MQLQRIRIGAFRNLREIEIVFDSCLPATAANPDSPPQPIRSHALIGQNGTGKSNLIEALITIFRDVDLDREAPFDYELDYSIRGQQKMRSVCEQIREKTQSGAELSAVAKWCVLFRNDSHLLRLICR